MADADRISVSTQGRTFYWDLPAGGSTTVLQVLVQSLGPAQEDNPPKPKVEPAKKKPRSAYGEPEWDVSPTQYAHRGPDGEALI